MTGDRIRRAEDGAAPRDAFRFLDLITASFVATLLLSNIASTKIVSIPPFEFDGGTVLFPLSYVFGDILTEVYGYRRARRVIWTGFVWIAVAAGFLALIDALPAAPGYELAAEFHAVLGQTPRIIAGSLVAFWAGSFVNSAIIARLKVATNGRLLWLRTSTSTLGGQGVDTAIFLTIAFWGVLPNDLLLAVFVSNYVFKVGVELLLTPVTYLIVGALKRAEGVDIFDTGIDLNPFRLAGQRPDISTIRR
ncbi:MAG: queuosine precursor transporter [Chloroflexia bacterium]|nr:queuosine precursor transporter [Chloroflexia bacterium]